MAKPSRPVNNPLLDPPALPHRAPALDLVKPEHVLPAFRFALAEAQERVEAIKADPALPTFRNTVEALEFSDRALNRVTNVFEHFSSSYKTPEIAALEETVGAEYASYATGIRQDGVLFERVKAVSDSPAAVVALDPDQKVVLANLYRDMVDSGAALADGPRRRLKEIDEELSKVTTRFGQNTTRSTAAYKKFVTDEAELAGLPQNVRDRYAARAAANGQPGQWLIELSPPPLDLLEYAENRALREEIFRARTNIAYNDAHDNRDNIVEIVKLRDEKAHIMGYATYADYVLKDRMLDTPAAVLSLLDTNAAAYRAAFAKELEAVKDYAGKQPGGPAAADFQPWDYNFYARKLKEETFDVNLEQAKGYFKLENVLEGVHGLAERLFSLRIEEAAPGKYPVNNPDLKVLEIKDRDSGGVIGLFYSDYYARPGQKSNGAWMNQMVSRGVDETGGLHLPIVGNNCNFPAPTDGKPTLLSVRDVETVFHEFGHALHGLLTTARYASVSGTNVKRDFVEVPSQFLENYVMEPRVLDLYAKHHETGERIPAELADKLKRLKTFDAGYAGLRQTLFGQLDMAYHTADPKALAAQGVEAFEDAVVAKFAPFPRIGGTTSTSFGHLFSSPVGYAVGYYGYKNAEVVEAAMMEKMRQSGDVFDPALSAQLRAGIYGQGGMKEPKELVRDFLGGDPDPNALFRREGLSVSAAARGTKPAPPAPA